MNTVSYLKEKLLETMKKVLIQTYGSSLKTDKEKLLSSYSLYNVLHCLSEIKTPLFHSSICNLAITVLYLVKWQFKIYFIFFFNQGETNFVSFFNFLFLLSQIIQYHCNARFFVSVPRSYYSLTTCLSKVSLFCHLVSHAQNNMLLTKQLETSEELVTIVIYLKSLSPIHLFFHKTYK